MSEATASSIDPRFDPRFQRGYVPDAAAPASGPVAARPAPDVPAASAAPPPVTPEPMRSEPIAEAAVHDRPAVTPETDPEPVFAALVDPDDDASGITPWLIAGWGVSVVAVILGIALWWASIMSQDYDGPSTESDRWLQVFGWMVAPTLIEAGLLGVVVMLVWTGVRHARRAGERR